MTNRVRYCCPACGGDIGEAISLDVVSQANLPPSQRIIFDILAKKQGAPVIADVLTSALYDHRRDGGPENARNVVSQLVFQLKRRIEKFGWTVASHGGGRGNFSNYRLVPRIKSA